MSWWVSLTEEEEAESEELEEGKEKHEEVSESLSTIKEKERNVGLLENIIIWLAVTATVVSLLGVTFITPEYNFSRIFRVISLIWLLAATVFLLLSEIKWTRIEKTASERIILIFAMIATFLAVYAFTLPIMDDRLARIAQILSLSWLVGATYWLKRSMVLQLEAEEGREELNVKKGKIEYVDRMKRKSKLLSSEKYHLRGRPDYILEIDDHFVPVEVKTGRVPKGPFFSHVLQTAAYCLLIEEDRGEAPSHGIVKYGEGEEEFEIEYDEDLKELLLEKLDDMRKAMETEDVHRNHHREGKCRNCSRRELCPESLV